MFQRVLGANPEQRVRGLNMYFWVIPGAPGMRVWGFRASGLGLLRAEGLVFRVIVPLQ